MKKLFILFIALSMTIANGKAQAHQEADSAALMHIVQDVFDGMRAGDSSMIAKHLLPSVIMHTVELGSNDEARLRTESKPEAWLEAVAKPKKQVWDERTMNYRFNITEGLATVWMDYAFFIDEQFSHCGVNSFQLVKLMGKWKIIYIIDTRKRENCNISAFSDTNN